MLSIFESLRNLISYKCSQCNNRYLTGYIVLPCGHYICDTCGGFFIEFNIPYDGVSSYNRCNDCDKSYTLILKNIVIHNYSYIGKLDSVTEVPMFHAIDSTSFNITDINKNI